MSMRIANDMSVRIPDMIINELIRWNCSVGLQGLAFVVLSNRLRIFIELPVERESTPPVCPVEESDFGGGTEAVVTSGFEVIVAIEMGLQLRTCTRLECITPVQPGSSAARWSELLWGCVPPG